MISAGSKPQLTKAQIAERDRTRRLRSDFEFFCVQMLKINPKSKELVLEGRQKGVLIPFVWNKAQRRTWKLMQELIAKKIPIKFVILKARQVGMSTFFCAYIFWQMWRQTNYRAGVVAYEAKTTLNELNETMATFYDNLPENAKPQLRAAGGKRVSKEEVYFNDRKSRCLFAVQKPKAIRGVALDGVLTTEVSFYDEADEFYGGFLPAMSEGASSILVLESSPSDGWFKDTYFHAKNGTNDRYALFIPWWMCDDLYIRKTYVSNGRLYDKKTRRRVEFPKHIKLQQRKLSKMRQAEEGKDVTDEQMWWWLTTCENNYQGDEEWMRQEYPDDDVTAFQRATRSAFKTCMEAVNRTVTISNSDKFDIRCGTLTSMTYTNPELDQQVRFEPEHRPGYIDQEKHPGMFMFRPPVAGYTYVLGADVADAEGEDDEDGERAFSAATVYCCNTREQVASWRGHIDPTDYGDELVKLGYFYNTALINLERNNMGRLTEHRVRTQLRYPMRFRWPDLKVGPEKLTKYDFWQTDATTKPLMISGFRQWVRDGLFLVYDPWLQEEMMNYQVNKGRFGPARGYFADRIIASSLCVMAVEQTEFRYKNIVSAAQLPDDLRSASGMAIRVLRSKMPVSVDKKELPEEFDEQFRVKDIYDEMFAEMV